MLINLISAYRNYIISIVIIFGIIKIFKISAEVRFVCPRPQSPQSSITEPPCGRDSFRKSFESDFTEVRPGPLTVRWEQTIFRAGSPSRISLGQWGNSPHCILLDHIPSRVIEPPGNNESCLADDYPLGSCHHLPHYITINIPDIKCDKCYLQLMTVVTPSSGICAEDKKTKKVNCTTHYSCSNIRIISSAVGSTKTLLQCKEYSSNLLGYWPYIETIHSKAIISDPYLGESEVNVSLDRFFMKYSIRMKGDHLRVHTGRDRVAIVIKPRGNTVFVIPLEKMILSGEYKAFDTLTSLLKDGKLAVRFELSLSNDSFYTFNLTIVKYSFLPGLYEHHSASISQHGWFDSPSFVGETASYPFVLNPSGICAPSTHSYSALLMDNDDTIRAILSHNTLQDRMHLQAIFSRKIEFGKPVVYHVADSHPGITDVSISDRLFSDDILTGAVLPWSYSHGDLLTKVTATVSMSNVPTLLTGSVHRSIKTRRIVENELFALHASLFPVNGFTWNITVMIIRKGLHLTDIRASSVVLFPSHNVTVINDKMDTKGRWVGTAQLTMRNSSIPMYLWMGYVFLYSQVVYEQKLMPFPTVQFEPLTQFHCEKLQSPGCWSTTLKSQDGWSSLEQFVPLHGLGTFFAPQGTRSFMYSVTLVEIKEFETVKNITLFNSKSDFSLLLPYGTESRNARKSLTIEGVISLDTHTLKNIKTGVMSLSVSTSSETVSGKIPSLNKVELPETTTVPTTLRSSSTIVASNISQPSVTTVTTNIPGTSESPNNTASFHKLPALTLCAVPFWIFLRMDEIFL